MLLAARWGGILKEQARTKRLEKKGKLPSGVTWKDYMVGEWEFSRWLWAEEILKKTCQSTDESGINMCETRS